ncbi:MAG: hypothetical protein WC082_09835 [Victivallales bacterium]
MADKFRFGYDFGDGFAAAGVAERTDRFNMNMRGKISSNWIFQL